MAKGEVDPTETSGNFTVGEGSVQFSSVQDDIYAMRKPTLCAPPRLSEDFPTLPLKQFQYFKGRLDIGGEGQAVSK